MTRARLELLGGFRLAWGDRDLTPRPRKARALLAYLALSGHAVARGRLARLLWGEVSEAQGRTSLRQSLRAIRKSLSEKSEWLATEDDHVELSTREIDVDVLRLRAVSPDAPLEAIVAGLAEYRGPLLEGLCAEEAGFEHFRLAQQERVREQIEGLMLKVVEHHRAAGDEVSALRQALSLVNIDWTRESAQRLVMEGYARTGQVAAARAHYQRYKEQLHGYLGMRPSDAMRRLLDELPRLAQRQEPTPLPSEPAKVEAAPPRALKRRVCVLFARPSIAPQTSPEDRHAWLSTFWDAASTVLRDRGADLLVPDADGMIALWGTTRVRGDEVARVWRAALALHEHARAHPGMAPPRIGVAQGLVVPAEELQPPWVGAPLGDARRLAASAEADVPNASESVRTILHEGQYRLPLQGRTAEIAELDRLLDRLALAGRGERVVIRGEAGLGKSRLAALACERADDRGIAVMRLHVAEFGEGDQRELARVLARQLVARLVGRTDIEASDAEVLGEEHHPPLRRLLGFGEADASAPRDGQTALLLELLREVASRGRILLVLEDAHWAHAEELAGLGDLLERARDLPLLVLITVRSEAEPRTPEWKATLEPAGTVRMELTALDESALRSLGDHWPRVDPNLRAQLARRAGGNPLFFEQLMNRAREGATAEDIPATVQGVVVARLDREASDLRAALELTAVVGQRMARSTLEALVGSAMIARSCDSGFLEPDGSHVRFRHALIRDAIYSVVHASQIVALHQRVAEHYRERDPQQWAEHLAAANDPRAAEALLQAARVTMTADRLESAHALAERALAAATGDEAGWEALLLRAELERRLARVDVALASYAEARRISGDASRQIEVLLGLAECLAVAERLHESSTILDEAEEMLRSSPSDRQAARVAILRGNLHFPAGAYSVCATEHGRALELARRAGEVEIEARAMSGLADAEYMRGNLPRAGDLFGEVYELARRVQSSRQAIMAQSMRGFARMFCYAFTAADRDFEESLRHAERMGDTRAELIVRSGRAILGHYRGRPRETILEGEAAVALSRRLGAKRFEPLAVSYCARARLELGDTERAQRELLEVRDRCLGYSDGFWLPVCQAALALTALTAADAHDYLRAGLAALGEQSPVHVHAVFYAMGIDSHLRDRDWRSALDLADAYEAYARPHPFRDARVVVARTRLIARPALGQAPESLVAEFRAAVEGLEDGFGTVTSIPAQPPPARLSR